MEENQRKAYCSPSYKSGVNSEEAIFEYLTLKSITSVFSIIKIVKWYLLPTDMMIYLQKIFHDKKKIFRAFLEYTSHKYCIHESINTTQIGYSHAQTSHTIYFQFSFLPPIYHIS